MFTNQEFLELAVETDPDLPLPPPRPAAKTLKESALKAIQEWHNKFGKAYKKLALGYNFLKFQKRVRSITVNFCCRNCLACPICDKVFIIGIHVILKFHSTLKLLLHVQKPNIYFMQLNVDLLAR